MVPAENRGDTRNTPQVSGLENGGRNDLSMKGRHAPGPNRRRGRSLEISGTAGKSREGPL